MSIKRFLTLCLLTCFLSLQACATTPRLAYHSFSFDGWEDGWYSGPNSNVQLQEYRYGDQYHMLQKKAKPGEPRVPSSTSINGPMPVGDFLYVRWLLKDTDEMIEHRVDLRDRLPKNMNNQTLTFAIKGKELHVYLVTDKAKSHWGEPPVLGTYRSELYLTYEIYPNKHLFD